ncbi:MAG TPA: hypothetical protein VFD89_10275 [Clostridia bacterium]|nr:hypothetical protein [Clostridia bacterium]
MAILFPEGPGGMPADALKYAPFDNYLIPGIILFSVIGLGSILSAFSIQKKMKHHAYIAMTSGWALVIWIVVQCIMLRTVVALHIIFFVIGLIEVFLSGILFIRQNLFPINLIRGIMSSSKKGSAELKLP